MEVGRELGIGHLLHARIDGYFAIKKKNGRHEAIVGSALVYTPDLSYGKRRKKGEDNDWEGRRDGGVCTKHQG